MCPCKGALGLAGFPRGRQAEPQKDHWPVGEAACPEGLPWPQFPHLQNKEKPSQAQRRAVPLVGLAELRAVLKWTHSPQVFTLQTLISWDIPGAQDNSQKET